MVEMTAAATVEEVVQSRNDSTAGWVDVVFGEIQSQQCRRRGLEVESGHREAHVSG